jgi:hypothetical protein
MEEKKATEAQIKLALQLYEEKNVSRRYTESELKALGTKEISDHITFMLNGQKAPAQPFDKICFAMVYKLFTTIDDQQYFRHKMGLNGYKEALLEQYELYKAAEEYAKKKTEGT